MTDETDEPSGCGFNADMVTITQVEYDKLERDSRILHALYAGGVDNWEWYGDSLAEVWAEDEKGEAESVDVTPVASLDPAPEFVYGG